MPSRFSIAIAAVFGLASTLLAGDEEIHACVHKNTGAVRIVSADAVCNPQNETPLRWGVAGPPGPGGLRILDGKDELVGPLLDSGYVARLIGDTWFALRIDRNGFVEQGVFYLYESTDCTGPAYLEWDAELPTSRGGTLGSGSTVTIYSAAAPIARRTIRSVRGVFSYGPAQPCFLEPPGDVSVGLPTTTTITMTPPFRMVN